MKLQEMCLKFNKNKCVAICMQGNPDIRFGDGTSVKKVEEAIYLGVKLTKNAKINVRGAAITDPRVLYFF